MKIKCGDCRYGVKINNPIGDNSIQCRWGPPQATYDMGHHADVLGWPELHPDEWCHRWKRILVGPEKIEQPAEEEE